MSQPTSASRGRFPAALAVLVVIGAIAATPFVTSFLLGDDDALIQRVGPQAEKVAALLAETDTVLADLQIRRTQLRAESVELTADSMAGVVQTTPAVLDDVEKALQKAARGIDALEKKYAGRFGTPMAAKAARGAAAAKATYLEIERLLKENESRLKSAEAEAKSLEGLQVGAASARSVPVVSYLSAAVHLQRARFESNAADAGRQSASSDRVYAAELLGIASDLMRAAASVKARLPQDTAAQLERRIAALQQALQGGEQALTQLDAEIGRREQEVSELRATAQAARRDLAGLEAPGGRGFVSNDYLGTAQQYASLSNQAREAEARADAIEFGTLEGATIEEGGDLFTSPYEGGRPIDGLVTLKARRDQAGEQLDLVRKALEAEQASLDTIQSTIEKQEQQHAEMTQLADECFASIDRIAARAAETDEAARKHEDRALAVLDLAAKAAASAVTASKKRVDDARSVKSANPSERLNERLEMILADKDSQAAAHGLAAGVAYSAAEILLHRISTIRETELLEIQRAAVRGEEPPAAQDEVIARVRERAVKLAEKAVSEWTAADNLIKAASYNLAGRSVKGADYRWQPQAGIAAGHLLLSQLADDLAKVNEQREKAYQALVEAAKGREGSPLVAPVVETVRYLQTSAE